ncbi:phospholipase [Aphanothece hegewaldii CCALA 016]|uniref:Phospholipase n=1 Tax=Aphanothece hegewaldii CCALA 016 TaxID=2107694 RepID=A0A2T1LZT6_9CHRO|nr:alpha/beta hydrolase [Aphanothece hegewaldii]PSF37934.1 phospholipase [Aphanothece hegewaldii CCALA 016]
MTTHILLKFLLTGVSVGFAAYLLLCILIYLIQNRLIFVPSLKLETTPKDLELSYEDVWIGVRNWNGKIERLHGWWIPGSSEDVLLYFHGNGGNISYNLGNAYQLHQLGFSVLMIDYRGYGKSEGKFPTEAEVYRDAQAAWNYLTLERGIAAQQIYLYGHSLGGAIAIDLAIRQPFCAGVIVDNTFTSMRDMAMYQPVYRFFPADLILNQRFDNLSKLKLLRVPLLLLHGTEDRLVPPSMSQVLYESATVPKKLLLVPYAGHNNLLAVAGEEFNRVVREFQIIARKKPRLPKIS